MEMPDEQPSKRAPKTAVLVVVAVVLHEPGDRRQREPGVGEADVRPAPGGPGLPRPRGPRPAPGSLLDQVDPSVVTRPKLVGEPTGAHRALRDSIFGGDAAQREQALLTTPISSATPNR